MDVVQSKSLAILLLAAGNSQRLGRPKQLIKYKGAPLVNHQIQTCLASKIGDTYVVLGSQHVIIQENIDLPNEHCLIHENWERGIGSSIAFGVSKIQALGYIAVMVLLADQYKMTAAHLRKLKTQHEENPSSIILSDYGKAHGPPSIFPKAYFEALMQLNGNEGAKKIMDKTEADLLYFSFPEGSSDIDTPEDLKKYLKWCKENNG